MRKRYFIPIIALLLPGLATAEILFEDNFDNHPDWSNKCLVCGKNASGFSGGGEASGIPEGWDFWRADEYWNPDAGGQSTPDTQPVMQISSAQHYGATGKAFIFHNESENDSPNGGGGGWSSDGMLSKLLPEDQREIYLRVRIKYQTPYQRHWVAGFSGATMKTLRFYHWDRVGSPYSYFEGGPVAPISGVKIGENEYGEGFSGDAIRCDPQLSNYYCNKQYDIKADFIENGSCSTPVTGWSDNTGNDTDNQPIGIFDGEWHIIQLHSRLNSAPGVEDGVYRVFYDGCLVKSLSDVEWIGVNGDVDAGWNVIGLGGNSFNNWLDIQDGVYQSGAEQWYAIDDVVVSTTYIPDDYVIGEDIPVPPLAPRELKVG